MKMILNKTVMLTMTRRDRMVTPSNLMIDLTIFDDGLDHGMK